MKSKALYAGSFDPITKGHLNIIERAARLFDSLTVSVVVNPNKQGFFTLQERMEIVREVTSHIPNVTVDSFSGLLADYVNNNGFCAVVRGLRTAADFASELQMAQVNAGLYRHGTETVFLMTEPKYSYISSSVVKEVASLGGSVDALVPGYVIERIDHKLREEKK
jgi:pantetheine-phosphate adenylyltransferase